MVLSREDEDSAKYLSAAEELLGKDIALNERGADDAYIQSQTLYTKSRIIIVIVLAASVATGLILALLISQIISKAMKKWIQVADNVSQGNLTVDIGETGKDEVGLLLAALKTMIEKWQRT